jgi:selenocysteine-specific elongation factor
VIIGTAGHIDHGKTTLVRALTGVDTDRLKEEKARGISIELGYAYVPVAPGANRSATPAGDDVLGFVDVPGHERLVHTMAAGASGIDFALLVIAADDGVMPQTREHLAILELLGIARGAVALTKTDRVDAARSIEVQTEIAATLATSVLRDAPVFPVDARQAGDTGVVALRDHLHAAAATMPMRRDDGLFRLAVDRVFTLPGHGTMVTGTVFSGQVKTGDALALMPNGTPVRVRGIHAQNRPAESGRAGQRCALNLAGVGTDDIQRGDWIADPRLLAPSHRIDVRLRLLDDADIRLSQWSPLHVHIGTAHSITNVVPLDGDDLAPGQSARVQFVFAGPMCAVSGDRFIVRNAQATRTVGGGVVLDPFAPSRKRRSPQRLAYLASIESMLADGNVAAPLRHAPYGVSTSELTRLTGEPRESLQLPSDAIAIDCALQGDSVAILRSHWQALRERVVAALRDFHVHSPDEPGPDTARLRRIAMPDLPDPLWRALIGELTRDGSVLRNAAWLHLPGHAATLSEGDEALAQELLPLIAAGRFDPPWVRDLARSVHKEEDHVRRVLNNLVRQGRLFQIVKDLFYGEPEVRELAKTVSALARETGGVEAARFRDAIGVGRKRAIQILEFFDRLGYTRRIRSAHVLRPDARWFSGEEPENRPPVAETPPHPVPSPSRGDRE